MLRLQQISFCGKVVQNLLSDEQKSYFLDKLYNNYQIKISDKDYIVLREKYLPNLQKNKYYLSTVTNGNRYLLYLTIYEGRYLNLFIDRKIKEGYKHPRMLLVDYKFDDSLYEQETLFGGELIKKKDHSWMFLLSNLLVYQEQKLNLNIIGKINIIYQILSENYTLNEKQPCILKVKKIFNVQEISQILEDFIPNLDYSCKALCFYPDNSKFKSFIYLLEKKKVSNVNNHEDKGMVRNISGLSNASSDISSVESIDEVKKIIEDKIQSLSETIEYNFKLRNTDCPDIYQLYTKYQEKDIMYGYAHIPSIKCSKYIQNKLSSNDYQDIIINCKYSTNFNKWEPQIDSSNSSEQHEETLESLILKLKI